MVLTLTMRARIKDTLQYTVAGQSSHGNTKAHHKLWTSTENQTWSLQSVRKTTLHLRGCHIVPRLLQCHSLNIRRHQNVSLRRIVDAPQFLSNHAIQRIIKVECLEE